MVSEAVGSCERVSFVRCAGLGYAYFYGNAVEMNQTKAFEYFLRAAETGQDVDSMFNAGKCRLHATKAHAALLTNNNSTRNLQQFASEMASVSHQT